jgi:hypothetical protein
MNPADVLKYGHTFVTRTLDGLPLSEWEAGGVCGVWSVKDIIGHLAFYEHLLTEVLAPFANLNIEIKLLPQMANPDINDVEAAARKDHTAEQVLAEYIDTFTYNQEQVVPKVPAAIWSQVGAIPWYGAEYSLDDYIVYSFYGHKREHSAEINVFKDKLKSM